ncbi:hypothetical protein C8R47DRAFT_1228399 [Mycena vitilis]|nr:hypothetical protein C8R47DRAFT_1228399 [Mycena vitilis]
MRGGDASFASALGISRAKAAGSWTPRAQHLQHESGGQESGYLRGERWAGCASCAVALPRSGIDVHLPRCPARIRSDILLPPLADALYKVHAGGETVRENRVEARNAAGQPAACIIEGRRRPEARGAGGVKDDDSAVASARRRLRVIGVAPMGKRPGGREARARRVAGSVSYVEDGLSQQGWGGSPRRAVPEWAKSGQRDSTSAVAKIQRSRLAGQRCRCSARGRLREEDGALLASCTPGETVPGEQKNPEAKDVDAVLGAASIGGRQSGVVANAVRYTCNR